MSILTLTPVLAYLGAIVAILATAAGRVQPAWLRWALPSVAAGLFIAFSLVTVAYGGLLPFWENHTSNLAGNQVWLDLVLAVTIAFYLIAPRARSVGMRLMPWAVAVILTACMALLPMLARLIWLEQRALRDPS